MTRNPRKIKNRSRNQSGIRIILLSFAVCTEPVRPNRKPSLSNHAVFVILFAPVLAILTPDQLPMVIIPFIVTISDFDIRFDELNFLIHFHFSP